MYYSDWLYTARMFTVKEKMEERLKNVQIKIHVAIQETTGAHLLASESCALGRHDCI